MDMNMNQETKDIIVALDIGTTKVCAIAGYRDEHGRIQVLSVGKVSSDGVLRGVISNIDKTVKAINDALDKISHNVPFKIKELHLGIAGQHIKSFQHPGILTRDDGRKEISQEDINQIISDMHKIGLPAGKKILHIIPQEYRVDNESGIKDPIGMSGNRLQTDFHIITGKVNAFNNLERCVRRANLQIKDLILEPIASAYAVVNDKELEAGIAIVDIGGGTTDLAIFHEGILRHTAVIPFGGNSITNDIKEGCTVMKDQAEKLKVKFGSALSDEIQENRTIIIPGLQRHDEKRITEHNLSLIIQARVEEILDYVYSEIIRSGYKDKLIGGIVLTGGGALLKNIKELTELHTSLHARIGIPSEYLAQGYNEELDNPSYATVIGLLIEGIKNREKEREKASAQEKQDELVQVESENLEEIGTLNFERVVGERERRPFVDDSNKPITDEVEEDQPSGNSFRARLKWLRDLFEAAPDSDL